MDQQLPNGTHVKLRHGGGICTIEALLAAGGQGEVYRARLDGQAVAMKWYFPTANHLRAERQRCLLESMMLVGAPDERFLWPLDLAESTRPPGFGYIMAMREPRFSGLVDLVKRRIDPSLRTLATAGFHLADSFLNLHSRGMSYRDISFGNAFLDAKTGEVRICDCDNVSVDGDEHVAVLGTPKFMAPEIVGGTAVPSTQTDLYSLAVLLFYFFHNGHPLDGANEARVRCLDLPARQKLYGTEAIFVFDPHDDANRPVPGVHNGVAESWAIYPMFLKARFVQAFTRGIRDPLAGRVRESEWRQTMVRLRDAIFTCTSCGAENFYDADATPPAASCWSCAAALSRPFRLKIGSSFVMLDRETQLYPHHVDDARLYDFHAPVAEVIAHPTKPDVWGLKNLGREKWVCNTADGVVADVPPGKSVTLAPGHIVHFGKTRGEISR